MKISHKLSQFAAQAGRGVSRPLYKFLRDMLTGMVAKKSILLSDIGRALNEPSDLLYTEKRLSRNLSSRRLNDSAIRENYLRTIRRDTRNAVVAFDLSDVRKEYSHWQPYLAGIWDDSRRERARGYWLTQVEAVREDGKHIPLWLEAWSQKTPDFLSQNEIIQRTITQVAAHTDRSAVWVFDRGFDNPKVMAACEAAGVIYVIRQVGKRHVIGPDGKRRPTEILAAKIPAPHRLVYRRIRHNRRYPVEMRCGSAIVEFPDGRKRQLIVVYRGSAEPMMLLSNSLDTSRASVIRLVRSYVRRWTVEEAIRAVKQVFELENLRPLTWVGIRRMVLFAFLAWAFLCKVAKTIRRQSSRIFGFYKSFGETPEFFYYRLAEAVAAMLLLATGRGP